MKPCTEAPGCARDPNDILGPRLDRCPRWILRIDPSLHVHTVNSLGFYHIGQQFDLSGAPADAWSDGRSKFVMGQVWARILEKQFFTRCTCLCRVTMLRWKPFASEGWRS